MSGFLRKLLFSVSAFFLACMVLSLFLQVIARELHLSVGWTEESARLTFIAMVFVATAYASLTSSHLRVTVIADILAQKLGQRIVDAFHLVILLGLDGFMVWYSSINFVDGIRFPNISPAMGFNQNYLFIFMIFGFAVNGFIHLCDLVDLRHAPKEQSA